MDSLFKSTLYTAIGAAVLATSKIKEFAEEVVQNNDFVQEEGRRKILQYINFAEDSKVTIEQKSKDVANQFLLGLKLPPTNELEIKFAEMKAAFRNKRLMKYITQQKDLRPVIKK